MAKPSSLSPRRLERGQSHHYTKRYQSTIKGKSILQTFSWRTLWIILHQLFFSCLVLKDRKMELRFARWIRNSEKSDISVEDSSSSCIQSKIKDPIIPSQRFRIAYGFWKYGGIEMSVQVVRTKLPMSVIRMCINQRDLIEHICSRSRVRKTPSARQQCWPESFCKSGKFLQQAHYWLKNFRIFWKMSGYYTKYPDNIKSVRMNWKVSGWSKSVGMNWKVLRWCKKCPDNIKNVSGYSKKSLDDLKMYMYVIWKVSGWF